MKIKALSNTAKYIRTVQTRYVKTILVNSRVKRAVLFGILAVVVASICFSTLMQRASAYSTFTQTDWSGGVGVSPTNQYSSTENADTSNTGEIRYDSPSYDSTAWCATANCNSTGWSKRKSITFTNGGSPRVDYVARVKLTYASSMKTDFGDIRFTNNAGNSDLDYYMSRKVDSSVGYFWVKIPSLPAGTTKIYVYYGNSSATTLSDVNNGVVIFGDNFTSGTLDTNLWDTSGSFLGGTIGEIVNGEVHQPIGLLTQNAYSLGTGLTLQYDYRFEEFVCHKGWGNPMFFPYFNSANWVSNQAVWNYDGHDCSTTEYKHYVHAPTGDPSGYASATFTKNQTYTIRASWKTNNTVDYFYSSDGGETFTQFDQSSNVANGSPTSAQFGIGVNCCTYGDWFSNITLTATVPDVPYSLSRELSNGIDSATLTSSVLNLGVAPVYGTVDFDYTGSTVSLLAVKLRSSNNSAMSGAPNFASCQPIYQNQAIVANSNCVSQGDPYIQYQVYLVTYVPSDAAITEVRIQYFDDTAPPTSASNIIIKKSSSGDTITNGSWTNDTTPYFSWTASDDGSDSDSSGVRGYCLYLGTDSQGDPVTSSGLLPDYTNGSYNGSETDGQCRYLTTLTYLDVANFSPALSFANGTTYYYIVRALDNSGNLSTSATASFKVDTQEPYIQTALQGPGFTNTAQFRVTWPTNPGLTAFLDAESGPAGVKYCITNIILGFAGCTASDANWYGSSHTSGLINDPSDVIPFSDGGFTLHPDDAARVDVNSGLTPGYNIVAMVALDNAGNVLGASSPPTIEVIVTTLSSGAPQNLAVSPTSNSNNAFSFTWSAPSLLIGPTDYCWTVNQAIAADGSNCTWTGGNITQLTSGPYATQQGLNTLYLMAKNGAGNFSNQEVASVTFTASTVAPGPPQDTEISDVSTRATSTWKLALSWSAPVQVGAGISSYKVYRSTDNATFTQVGSTSNSNLSFIDSGLSQQTYYYHIKACDSANACSVAGNVVSKLPTGRYTTPPSLTADSNQPRAESVGTKKATILWFTDRSGDSKVAFGTAPGQYGAAEIGSSNQVTDHSVTLTNLQPGTTYYYVAKWTDQDGNTGVSQERSFRTADAPGVTDVETSNVGTESITLNFTSKNASKVRIYYGQSDDFGGSKEINTSTSSARYSIRLDGLGDGTRYLYRFATVDSDGNEYRGDVRNFTTLARPRIIGLRFQPVEGAPSSTQKVTWTTNVPSNSTVTYGPKGENQIDAFSSALVTEHEVVVDNLRDDSDYTLIARSTDAAGNTAVSDLQTFRTALDTRPPKISDITVEASIRGNGPEAKGQVVVSWRTDEKATSQVAFAKGQSGTLTSRTPKDDRLSLEHTVVFSDLDTASIYQVQPISEDGARNVSYGERQTAIIGRGTENVFSIIFNALQKIFGL